MGPFNHRSSKEEQDSWEKADRDFSLRAIPREEVNSPTFGAFPSQKTSYPDEKNEIRNLGFFREQERHFTQNEDEEEWEERQSPINFVLVIGLLVALCVIGWLGYKWASSSAVNEPPFITADPTPFKIKPENPGGMVIPHQDKLVYDRIAPDNQQPVEHLLPAPEQPIAPTIHGQPQTFVDANGQMYYAYPVPQEAYAYSDKTPPLGQANTDQEALMHHGEQQPPQQQLPTSPQTRNMAIHHHQGLPNQPTPVLDKNQPLARGIEASPPSSTIPPYGNFVPQSPTQTANTPVQVQQEHRLLSSPQSGVNKTQQSDVQVKSETAISATDETHTIDQIIEQELGASSLKEIKTTNPKNETYKAILEPKQKPATNTYKIQVATLSTKEEAEIELKRIKSIDPALFANKTFSIQKMEIGNTKKPSFRVIISSFPTPNAAAQFSNKLKIHKVKGIVINQSN